MMDEGRWMMEGEDGRGKRDDAMQKREIKKVRKLENRRRNAGWINPINLINSIIQSTQ
jgi:hypothetical protein